MPRFFDYQNSSVEWDAQPLEVVRYGHGEISHEQLLAEQEIDGITFGRAYNISFNHGVWDNEALLEEVFSWLEVNATAPWHWQESWENNRHSLGIYIHLERLSDQAEFMTRWGDAFKRREPRQSELTQLAVMKGVLPPQEGVFSWTSRHCGFEGDYKQLDGENDLHSVTFHVAELEEAFIRDWVDTGIFQAAQVPHRYEAINLGHENSSQYDMWLHANASFHPDVNTKDPETGERLCLVQIRNAFAEQVFVRRWGKEFKQVFNQSAGGRKDIVPGHGNGFPKVYAGPWLTNEARPIPEDFRDYLEGRCDFSAVDAPYDNRSGPKDYEICGHLLR